MLSYSFSIIFKYSATKLCLGKEEVVKVTVVEAADLTAMRTNGPADPCVKLTIGDHKIETPAVTKTLTPVVYDSMLFLIVYLTSNLCLLTRFTVERGYVLQCIEHRVGEDVNQCIGQGNWQEHGLHIC